MKMLNPRRLALGSTAVILSLGSTLATTLVFDELPAQPADGLSIGGVTFGFEVSGVPSADATYNVDLGLGSTAHTTDPVLEGDATGVLTLTFAAPTDTLSFGLLLLGAADYTPGAVIELYDGLVLVDTISLDTVADVVEPISEALFSWSDPLAPIDRAVVDFDDSAGRFAMDNLAFVPEPTPVLAALGLIGFGLAHHLRRRRG